MQAAVEQVAVALLVGLQLAEQQSLDPRTQTAEQLLTGLQLRYEATWRSLSGFSLMAVAVRQWQMEAP